MPSDHDMLSDLRTEATSAGITVTVSANGHQDRPTRYAMSLRRQRANKVRAARGDQVLPAVRAGDCDACEGWGVIGKDRERCPVCKGTGGEG